MIIYWCRYCQKFVDTVGSEYGVCVCELCWRDIDFQHFRQQLEMDI